MSRLAAKLGGSDGTDAALEAWHTVLTWSMLASALWVIALAIPRWSASRKKQIVQRHHTSQHLGSRGFTNLTLWGKAPHIALPSHPAHPSVRDTTTGHPQAHLRLPHERHLCTVRPLQPWRLGHDDERPASLVCKSCSPKHAWWYERTWVDAVLHAACPRGEWTVAHRVLTFSTPLSPYLQTQEIPSLLVFLAVLLLTQPGLPPLASVDPWLAPRTVLAVAFTCHYIYRSIVFPCIIRGGKPTPVSVWAMSFVFCIWNGFLQVR